MKTLRLFPACAAIVILAGYAGDSARGDSTPPAKLVNAPYQEFILPVNQKAAHKASITVIKQMGFQFPVAGAQSFPAAGDVDKWQRFQFSGMGRFTTIGPEEGTIIAVRVDEDHYDNQPSNSTSTPSRSAITAHFKQDPHPSFYHAETLRADFTDEPNGGGTKVQVWITNATLDVNPLSGSDFGSTIAQLNIPTNKSPLYGQFFNKLLKALKLPKPVGIAPSGASP